MKNQSWYPWAELCFVEHSVTKTSGKKSFYQREMTSSGTRLRFTVIAVNMETEGQVSWRVFITETGHFGARRRLTSVPCWPAGICVRLWLAFLLSVCAVLHQMHAAAQVCSDGKPSPLIKPPVRALSLIWLHHDRQQSCPTECRMRFFQSRETLTQWKMDDEM